MAGWSSLGFRNIGKTNLIRTVFASSQNGLTAKNLNYVPVRNSGHSNNFLIRLSQYRFTKLRDLAHFYLMLGVIPLGALILYCNIFIGPAKLAAIPEGYVPKHWEYYEHPITRWFAKMLPSPQECYEKDLHKIHILSLRQQIFKLEQKVENLMREKEDYQAWYYVPTGAKYTRRLTEEGEKLTKHRAKGLGTVV